MTVNSAAVFLQTKAAAIQICSIGWFSGWDSPVANADRSRPPVVVSVLQSRLGHQSHQSRKQNPSVAYSATASRA